MEIENCPTRYVANERAMVIGKTRFRIRSVFIGQMNLDDALRNIIVRKME
jgi:hypothetical protein